MLRGLLFPVESGTNPVYLASRALLLLFLAGWGWKFITASVLGNYVGQSFMHNINLPFHEAGHILFSPFGRFMQVLGGTLGQILMPCRPQRGTDLRYELSLEFEEAVFGIEKEIEVPRKETCKNCNGNRAEPGTSPIRCPECNGTGEVRRQTGARRIIGSPTPLIGGPGEVQNGLSGGLARMGKTS